MRRSLVFCLICVLLAGAGSDVCAATSKQQEQLQSQYEDALKKIKDDDEAGFEHLAQWCQTNRLPKEADHVWQLLLTKKRETISKAPSLPAYQSLLTWCSALNLKQTEEVKHEMLSFDYGQRKAKVKADDPKEMQALAQWCQGNKLSLEALDCWQSVLAAQPENGQARGQIDAIRAASWAEAPTGLLKNQKVPGYTQDTAWYHVSVPGEHKNTRTGLPLIIYLHGGQHNVGSADNIVAFAQTLPAFKKAIVVFPNHLKTWWAHPRELTYLLDTLDQVMLRWHVDPKRIYLMGGSMGGNGVWAWGSQCPEIFAALSPQSGFWADNLEFPMNHLIAKPIYILHGTKDTTVPIDGARKAFELLKKDNKDVTMQEVDCGHQPPNDEINKGADWMLGKTNKQDFDMKALKERIAKMEVPKWLKQFEGN